jgi:elongation factor 1-gamma
MALTLYTYPGNFRAYKAQIAALYNGITLDVQDNAELKTQYNKAPVLATKNGQLFESNAIAAYVAGLGDSNLLGQTAFQKAQIRQWVDFSAFDIEPQRAVWLLPIREVIAFNGKAYATAKKDLKASLQVLNAHLESNTFLVGNCITLADITIACALVEPMQELFDNNFRKGLENVVRWFLTCVNQNEFNQVLGKVILAKKETRAVVPKKQQESKKRNSKKQSGKKPAQQQAPAKPKKKVNPLDALPKSSMSMDATKKLFFAAKGPTEFDRGNPAFWGQFWDTFDDKGYAFWTAHYDYNEDNKEFWKTQNAVNFYIQRLDQLRKYGFAVLNILGNSEEDSYFEICGMFLTRGTEEIPFELKDTADSDYYKFVKVPTATKKDKEFIESYFRASELPGNPKDNKFKVGKLLERRYFK